MATGEIRARRVYRGLFAEDANEPCKQHATDPKPMGGATMRKDGYAVLGRRRPYGLPGDIEENYPEADPYGPLGFVD